MGEFVAMYEFLSQEEDDKAGKRANQVRGKKTIKFAWLQSCLRQADGSQSTKGSAYQTSMLRASQEYEGSAWVISQARPEELCL